MIMRFKCAGGAGLPSHVQVNGMKDLPAVAEVLAVFHGRRHVEPVISVRQV
ncbi:hypothetical protein [Pseudooceanicola lipolyticus]|uniref:hypothetical protein n=1 Tax=Pseudooceanicola lipolyticus TaxID=2029104 RepID=UPI00155EA6CC|nr:hypothetical protein [Pseudooceanicola lipolyticus]